MKDHLKITSLTFTLVLLSALGQTTPAQIRNQVFAGTRPRSMGEAFVAVADDGNAIYWNPAGLGRMERIQASFAYADLYGLGIHNYYASFLSRVYFIPPLTDYLAFGVDWLGIHALDRYPITGDEEFGAREDHFNFSLALTPPKYLPLLRHLTLGANGKYFKSIGELDGHRDADFGGWGWDFGMLYDLGALRHITNGLQIGVMVHDVGNTHARHKATRTRERLYHENIRYGLSYRPFGDWPGGKKIPISDPIIALDFDDRIHFGLEFWLAKTLALRAGWQKDLHAEGQASFSFGVGFRNATKDFPEVRVDYALTDTPVLPNTNKQFGGTLLIKDNPRLVRIEEAYVNDVFASLYKHYGAAGDLGRAKIRNFYNDTLEAEISFIAPPYTASAPTPQIVKVPPGEFAEVPLRAVFDQSILQCATQERLNARIEASYALPRRGRFRTARSVEYVLHGRGCLTWDDPGKAAAFVTVGEKCVREFAAQVAPRDSLRAAARSFFTDNMVAALRLYEALRALGFKYVPDPTTPYVNVAGKKLAVDRIDYPADFLASKNRSGDCDDLAVLYATLLESVGIETALLSTPSHVFMMFNTGIPARRQSSLPLDSLLFINHRGLLWIPVETTLIPSSFLYAWVKGSANYRDETAVEIIEIAANQQPERYQPAEALAVDCPGPPAPPIANRVAANFATLALITKDYFKKFEDHLAAQPDHEPRRNAYAALLAQNGKRRQARTHLDFILQKNPRFSPALNNLGNIAFIEKRFAQAESLYAQANRSNPLSKAGTYLNLSFLYVIIADTSAPKIREAYLTKAVEAMTEAGRWLNNDNELALSLLGIGILASGGKGDPQEQKKAARDTALAASSSDTTKKQTQAKPLSLKLRAASQRIKRAMQTLFEGKPLRPVVFDEAGPKGKDEVDEDFVWLLWWNT